MTSCWISRHKSANLERGIQNIADVYSDSRCVSGVGKYGERYIGDPCIWLLRREAVQRLRTNCDLAEESPPRQYNLRLDDVQSGNEFEGSADVIGRRRRTSCARDAWEDS